MSNIHAITRRFERFLSSHGSYYNNNTEVRPDSVGALSDEITHYPIKQHTIGEDKLTKIAEINYFPDQEKIEIKNELSLVRINYEKETIKEFFFRSRGKK